MYVQWQGMSIVVTRRTDKATRNAGDSVANSKNEQLLFVTLDFKPCKRCSDCRKLLIERSDLVAARVTFLSAMREIK